MRLSESHPLVQKALAKAGAKPTARAPHSRMNRTEARFAREVLELWKTATGGSYFFEAIKLRLAKATFYTPDFIVFDASGATFYEVKGFWRDDARVKLKVAAEMFPWFKFVVVKATRRGWLFEEVK